MASVYVETTVPSYYFETRSSAQVAAWRTVTRTWWDEHRKLYNLFTSRFVLLELQRAPVTKRRSALGLMRDVVALEETPSVRDVAEYYIEHRLMPVEAAGDAYHLAIASVHQIDFLLTWNCRHLANANKDQHIRVLNARLGLHVPVVTTPMTLMPTEH